VSDLQSGDDIQEGASRGEVGAEISTDAVGYFGTTDKNEIGRQVGLRPMKTGSTNSDTLRLSRGLRDSAKNPVGVGERKIGLLKS
jgi:hypothetical protein